VSAFPLPALLRPGLHRLAARLEALGYPVAEAEAAGGGCALLVDRGGDTRAGILPAALGAAPDDLLERTAAALRALAARRGLRLLAWGEAPDAVVRRRLREAGVALALYEPLDEPLLRFQVNRALAPHDAPPRRALRAPLDREVALCRLFRTRPARLYSLSSQGAFILTDAPLAPGRRLVIEVPAGLLSPRARARVVLANGPDRPAHPELPPGMAVAFQDLDAPGAAVIDRLVEERLAALAV
jgi:hypothetical protein